MTVYVRTRGQTFTGQVVARGRLRVLVRYDTVFPPSERVDWFWRWRVHTPVAALTGQDTKRYRCMHVRPSCRCGHFG